MVGEEIHINALEIANGVLSGFKLNGLNSKRQRKKSILVLLSNARSN